MPLTPEELDARLTVLKRHRVAVFKEGDLALEFDASAFEPASAAPDPEKTPDDEVRDAQKKFAATALRSAG